MSMTVVRCAGGPRERGLAVGRALAEPIARSLNFYRGFLEGRGIGTGGLPQLLGPHRDAARAALPELVVELDGVAEGAGAPPWELFAANAWEELEPMLATAPVERCTAFAVAGPEGTILAHNEQWYAGDAGNTAVIVAEPDTGPSFASPTVVACLPAVGMNGAGIAQGVMSLSHRDDRAGVPRVPVSRHRLQAGNREEAFRRATIPGRAGGYAYVTALAGGERFVTETTATAGTTLVDMAAHTNHYMAPPLAEGGWVHEGSVSRLDRLRELLTDRRPSIPSDAMAILADHESEPRAICLHPDSADGDEAVGVLFSMVCHLEERRMWVAEGNPCSARFEEIDLEGAFG